MIVQSESQKRWKLNNRDKIKEYARKNYLKNRERFIERSRKNRLENPKKVSEYQKQYRRKNHDRLKKYNNDWSKNNRAVMNKHHEKHSQDRAHELNMSVSNYKTQILYWTRAIKKFFDHKCQVCGKKSTASHHLIYISTEPKLTFNNSNGIALCDKCHNEVHGRNISV